MSVESPSPCGHMECECCQYRRLRERRLRAKLETLIAAASRYKEEAMSDDDNRRLWLALKEARNLD